MIHHLVVKTSYMGDKFFLRKIQFHFVADTTTGYNVASNITLIVPNPINASVFHSVQPFCVRPSTVRRWLSTIKTILHDYFSDVRKRKSELAAKFSSPTAIFTVDPKCSCFCGRFAWKSDGLSIPTIFSYTASFCFLQSVCGKLFFSSAITAHKPKMNWMETLFSSFSYTRPGMRDNRKMPYFHTSNISKTHVFSVAARGESQ
jgi:hypothetical protein